VTSLSPAPVVVDAAQSSGGLCGGTFLNRSFERYLDGKFQGHAWFYEDLKRHAMAKFEDEIKKIFVGDIDKTYKIAFRGIPDNKYLGVYQGFFHIPGEDLDRIFREVVDQIIRLVKAQIRATDKRVRSVLLAGGFGKSGYLRHALTKALDPDYRSIQVMTVKNR
jgi:hypothetical protein